MKTIIKTTILCLFIFLLITRCGKNEETFPTHEPPIWQVDFNAGYYENMTAVIKLPNNLAHYADNSDQLAAFDSDSKCRGVGTLISGLYFVSIKGTPEDQSNIHFMYYSVRNKYLYQTDDLFSFDADQIFGTVDAPKEIFLNVVK